MKVRDIIFDTLAANYDSWTVDVRIFSDDGKYCNKQSSFKSAKEYLTALGYLDRECEVGYQAPVDPRLDKYIRFDILIKPGDTYEQTISNMHNNEVTKMKVKDIDFKKLQKENDDYRIIVSLKIDNGTNGSNKDFGSFTALNNYLTSHPKWFEYAESNAIFTHEERWNNIAKRIEKYYELTIRVKPEIPYYQFHNGNCININGNTYAPEIKDIIFNPPATIVKWADGTKTVVKARGDDAFDPEVGLAMAISKKMYGNKYNYYNVFKKWLKKFDDNAAKKALNRVAKAAVCAATSPNPASYRLRELEEINLNLKKLTGYDSEELLKLYASGLCNYPKNEAVTNIEEPRKYLNTTIQTEETNCKDCTHFTPLPGNDPWEDDGVCNLDSKGTFTMNSCDKAVKKSE